LIYFKFNSKYFKQNYTYFRQIYQEVQKQNFSLAKHVHERQLYLLEQYSESFEIWSAIKRIKHWE